MSYYLNNGPYKIMKFREVNEILKCPCSIYMQNIPRSIKQHTTQKVCVLLTDYFGFMLFALDS